MKQNNTGYFGILILTVMLSACGGGGGSNIAAGNTSGITTTPLTTALPAASSLINLCATPRAGTIDNVGSIDTEKSYLRSFTDETYLWYKDVPKLDPARYLTPQTYFADLKSNAITASGRLVDEFHWSFEELAYNQQNAGIEEGYGVKWAFANNMPPRGLIVANVESYSPANGVFLRGDMIQTVDGADFVNGYDVAVLNEGIFPTKISPHTFEVLRQGKLVKFTISPAVVITTPVQYTKVVNTPTGKVGYIYFDEHIAKSEPLLVDAFNKLKSQGATDLVLDLRYNSGGLLYIASQVAYMIAGSETTKGKAFDKLIYNDKRSKDNIVFPFYSVTSGIAGSANIALPTLNLKKVTVLTGHSTASASEAIINGLRGVDVEVVLIGDTTRGKPYGFVPQLNCGFVYYSIQFKGENNKSFGDYADGFPATCAVKDDFSNPLGDSLEGQFAAALQYRATKTCPTPFALNSVSASLTGIGLGTMDFKLLRSPAKELSIPTEIKK